jgi:hypothetical protein
MTRLEETYPTVVHCCLWSRNLKNEEVLARDGPQAHKGEKMCVLISELMIWCILSLLISNLIKDSWSSSAKLILCFYKEPTIFLTFRETQYLILWFFQNTHSHISQMAIFPWRDILKHKSENISWLKYP